MSSALRRARMLTVALLVVVMLGAAYFGISTLPAQDRLRLSAEEGLRYYAETREAQRHPEMESGYAFISGVPLIPPLKTVSSKNQVLTCVAMQAFTEHLPDSRKAFVASFDELRGRNADFARVQKSDYNTAIKTVKGAHLSKEFGDAKLTPKRELLTKGGYENSEKITRLAGTCLQFNALCEAMALDKAVRFFFARSGLAIDFHHHAGLSWDELKKLLAGGAPLLVESSDGAAFLVLGYYHASDGRRLLLAYDPLKIERSIRYAGWKMPESELPRFKAEHPKLAGADPPKYLDDRSLHIDKPPPGFCVLNFRDDLKFTYIASTKAQEELIAKLVRQALESAPKAGPDS